MKKVAIMTDTITFMSQEIADRYGVKTVPMGITIEGKAYPENEINLTEFCEQLPEWKETLNGKS